MERENIKTNSMKVSYLLVFFLIIITAAVYYFSNESNDFNPPNPNIATIHYVDAMSPSHKKLVELFNKKYKGRIKVIPIDLPFNKFSTNERKELFARSLRSKSEKMDVFAVDIVWSYRFAKWAENLTPYFSESEIEAILPQPLPTCYLNDTLIAFPLTIDLGSMYYRDDIISDLPDYYEITNKLNNSITWQEFIELGKRLKGRTESFYVFPGADYEGLMCSFTELVLNQDRNFFDNGKIDLTRPAAVNAVKMMRDLVYKYNFTPQSITSYTEYQCHEYYFNQKTFALRSWPPFPEETKIFGFDNTKIRRVPLPHFEGTNYAAVFGGWNLMISKFSKNKPEALEFIKFLLSKESQKILFELNGSLPVAKAVYDDETIINKDVLNYYWENFENGVHRPMMTDYSRVSEISSYYIHKVLTGELETVKAMEEATRLIKSNEVIFK